jgi:hypothetical protein
MIEMPDDYMFMRYESASIDFDDIDYRGLDRGDNSATLYGLRSEDKKKGHASKLMDYVCKIADMYNINLYLQAGYEKENENLSEDERNDMLSHDELISFYRRKGFVFREGSNRGERSPTPMNIDCDESIKILFDRIKAYYLELEEQFA